MASNPPARSNRPVYLFIGALLVLLVASGVAALIYAPRATPAHLATINARDEQGGLIDPINVWKSYTDRSQGIAGRAHDGDRVTFLQQQGGATQIELPNGARGWVNSAFIRN